MDSIIRRDISDPDRAFVQEDVARSVESNFEWYLEQYCLDHRSFGGRYIAADLFKEMFAQYRESKESRNLYNTCVHNSAAVLAAEQFRRIMVDESYIDSWRDKVVLLTGIPGAGKTSSILTGGKLPNYIHAVFEGQLVKPTTTFPKIQQVLDAGLKPVIIAVHTAPEMALMNTFQRFREEGRGASIGIMAEIQGGLPDGLRDVQRRFGDAVQLEIMDCRDWLYRKRLVGWKHIEVLESEGKNEQIRKRLENVVKQLKNDGSISDECFRQASGAPPVCRTRNGMGATDNEQFESNGGGRGISQVDSERFILNRSHVGTFNIRENCVVQHLGRGEEVNFNLNEFPLEQQNLLARFAQNDTVATINVGLNGKPVLVADKVELDLER